jgi:hypothetical protein
MHQNPALVEALGQDRIVDLRQSAQARAISQRETRRHRIAQAARNGTGWLLVDLGLRLAMPSGTMKRRSA